MATIRDVAAAAGVSATTASRALSGNGRVSPATIVRVGIAVDALDYQPNEIARSLLSKRTMTLGLVVPDITNPFFPELVAGAERAASALERTIFLVEARSAERARHDIGLLRGRAVDGIIVIGNPFPSAADLLTAVGSIPLIVVDRAASMSEISTVCCDHFNGGNIGVDHLVGLGHKRIIHLAGPVAADVSAQRVHGYEFAMRSHGLTPHVVPAGFEITGGAAAVEALLADHVPFTALTAANDLSAIGAMRALSQAGLSVPGRVSVVGYDDIQMASFVSPALTTVRQPSADLGSQAVELIARQIEGETKVIRRVLPVELVARESTGRANS